MLSGSFPIIVLSNHATFCQTQIAATDPLIVNIFWSLLKDFYPVSCPLCSIVLPCEESSLSAIFSVSFEAIAIYDRTIMICPEEKPTMDWNIFLRETNNRYHSRSSRFTKV
jgi:hypothetical protein